MLKRTILVVFLVVFTLGSMNAGKASSGPGIPLIAADQFSGNSWIAYKIRVETEDARAFVSWNGRSNTGSKVILDSMWVIDAQGTLINASSGMVETGGLFDIEVRAQSPATNVVVSQTDSTARFDSVACCGGTWLDLPPGTYTVANSIHWERDVAGVFELYATPGLNILNKTMGTGVRRWLDDDFTGGFSARARASVATGLAMAAGSVDVTTLNSTFASFIAWSITPTPAILRATRPDNSTTLHTCCIFIGAGDPGRYAFQADAAAMLWPLSGRLRLLVADIELP